MLSCTPGVRRRWAGWGLRGHLVPPCPRAGVSAGLRLPPPTGGRHCARRGHRRVHISSGLGAGVAAVCGVVQSLRCNQVRRPLPPGIHGKTMRSKIAGAHNTFRIQKILSVTIGTLSPCVISTKRWGCACVSFFIVQPVADAWSSP